MRLVRLGLRGEERPGLLIDGERVVDVSAELRDFGPSFFASGGLDGLPELIGAGQQVASAVGNRRWGAPIARPGKIIGIGMNYTDHAREAGASIPTEPVIFMKAANSVSGPFDPIRLPPGAEKVDWEVELGVVVGSEARYLEDEEAGAAAIAGYLVAHDVSERRYQLERGGQWVKGKSAESFCPIGPWLVTPDEVDSGRLELVCRVNGETMQQGNTADMLFGPAHLVWYLSQFMVLEPGDLVLTGTPAGIGMTTGRYLTEGDVVELSITGLGIQRQECVRASVNNRTKTPFGE